MRCYGASSCGSQGCTHAGASQQRQRCRQPCAVGARISVCAVACLALQLCGSLQTAAGLQSAVNENHPRFYVADIPEMLNVRTMTDYDVRRFFTQFGADPNGVWSNPIGDYVTERDGMELRNTYMYGLDVLFHRNMLQSKLRVQTAAEADVVYLPIYADLGCRLAQENEADLRAWQHAVEGFWGTFNSNFPDVDKKPHFLVLGRREAENMAYCGIEGTMYGKVEACNFLCHPYAQKLITLTVEVFTGSLDYMAPKPLRPTSVTVPWPGHWHMHSGSPYFQTPFNAEAHKAARQYLAMESLKVRLPLRELLYKSCMERSSSCLHYNPRGQISQFNQSEIYGVIKSAWYCIQPPGDGPSRHATMDCLAANTMPVFFDPHLTAVMPFSDILDFSEFTEYIDPAELQSQQANAIDVIQAAFTEETALAKAARLHQVKHLFLYSINPEHSLIRWDEAYSVHPLDDAFTASMKALLRKSCELGMLGKCNRMEAGRKKARGTAPSQAPKGLLRPTSGGAGSESDGLSSGGAAAAGDTVYDQSSSGGGGATDGSSGERAAGGDGLGEDGAYEGQNAGGGGVTSKSSGGRSSGGGSQSSGGGGRAGSAGGTSGAGRRAGGSGSVAKPKQPQWGDDEASAEDMASALPRHGGGTSIGGGGWKQDAEEVVLPHSRPHKFSSDDAEERARRAFQEAKTRRRRQLRSFGPR